MWLPHPDDPHYRLHARLPQFLVISPPKTGSTWLADNLRHHPQLFVPRIKEVKYFSSLFKWVDLGWYATHFVPAGDRVAGEASPSYAALPAGQIRMIRRLMPDVKLVFLMRDPVSRAWSHAKHSHHFREANFADCAAEYGTVTDAEWRANFAHDWPLTNGDYLGQLRRWTSVFPPGQIYIGFYESIATRPDALLREVFSFLGVDPDVDLAGFPLAERILPGPSGILSPQLGESLRRLLQVRTTELAGFLHDRFGLKPPPEWEATLGADPPPDPFPPAFRREADDGYLFGVLAQEEKFHSAYRQIHLGYRGYDIVFYRGLLVAVPQSLGPGHLPDTGGATLHQLLADRTCLVAPTLIELKEQVTNLVLERGESRLRAAEADLRAAQTELRAAREQTARVVADLSAAVDELQRPSRTRVFVRSLGRAGRRLMSRLCPVSH
ncbi:MAG: Sulfotransferase domain protein [Gemmataceae bacterium]|nr:Sulfotransferase domain protein [Gemmataceae bacterium]